jgi:hypothetical protein
MTNVLNDLINPEDIVGEIKVSRYNTPNFIGSPEIVYDGPNALTALAKVIIATLLGGTVSPLDTLSVVASSVILANGTSFTVTYTAPGQVRFTASFDGASFNGTFDELRLTSSVGGDFSTKTGLAITKTSAQSMVVSWRVTVNV